MDTLSSPSAPLLTVVVPLHNEGAGIDALMARLRPVLESLGCPWEILCVNDGSRDDTLVRLKGWHLRDPRIKVLDLSRNFGKEAALSAGLLNAAGAAVVMIDADLQHPPELIPELVARWREGYEMVYAARRSRSDQGVLGRSAAHAYYWILHRLTDIELPRGAGDFRLLDRKVVDALNAMPERNRFMKGMFAWIGFRQTAVEYDVAPRSHGKTRWGFLRLMRFGLVGLTAFSNLPLQLWSFVGAIISGTAFLYIVVRVVRSLVHGIDVPGYESIIISILFLGGIQLLSLGIIGDYIGRIFNEVKNRPLFVVRESWGLDPESARTVAPDWTVGARPPR